LAWNSDISLNPHLEPDSAGLVLLAKMGKQGIIPNMRLGCLSHQFEATRIGQRQCALASRHTDNFLHVAQTYPTAMIIIFQHTDGDSVVPVVLPVNRQPDVLKHLAPQI
jgi:hypothetical protein